MNEEAGRIGLFLKPKNCFVSFTIRGMKEKRKMNKNLRLSYTIGALLLLSWFASALLTDGTNTSSPWATIWHLWTSLAAVGSHLHMLTEEKLRASASQTERRWWHGLCASTRNSQVIKPLELEDHLPRLTFVAYCTFSRFHLLLFVQVNRFNKTKYHSNGFCTTMARIAILKLKERKRECRKPRNIPKNW